MDLKTLIRASVVTLPLILLGAVGWTQDSGDEAEYSRKGADTCLACHEDQATLGIFLNVHGSPHEAESPFGHGQLQCEACHGPGDAHSARVRRGEQRPAIAYFSQSSVDTALARNAVCLGCHEGDLGVGWHAGPHDSDEIACNDCHSSHTARDPMFDAVTQNAACGTCHRLQRNETRKAFAHPVAEGELACGDCHQPHADGAATSFARQTLNDTCYSCHADKRGPYLWEHAPATEDCALCHAPHGSNHPGMLTQRAPLLCQSCHAASGHPSLPQDASGLPSGSPSQYLLGRSCMNCHSQVHGSNHPSGATLAR